MCVKEAKAVEVKAPADAKLGKEIGEARKEAADEKRDADYKVAIDKCDALAGGISEALSARPVQAALASAGSFAFGAVLPLAVAALAPAQSRP